MQVMNKEEVQEIMKEAEENCYGDPKLFLLAAILNELQMISMFVFDGFKLGEDEIDFSGAEQV